MNLKIIIEDDIKNYETQCNTEIKIYEILSFKSFDTKCFSIQITEEFDNFNQKIINFDLNLFEYNKLIKGVFPIHNVSKIIGEEIQNTIEISMIIQTWNQSEKMKLIKNFEYPEKVKFSKN